MQLKKISTIIVSLFTSLALLAGCGTKSTSSHEHTYKLVSEVLATCNSDGIKAHYECEECGKNFDFLKQEVTLESLIIPAHHSLVHTNKEDATCVHDGHKEFWSCSACGKLFDDAEGKHEVQQSDLVITDGPHSLEHIVAKEGNCIEKGNIEYWHCTLCGEYFLDADGVRETTLEETFTTYVHVIKHVDAKDSTCEEAGYLEHYECTRCGKYFSDNQGNNEITPESVVVPMAHNMVHHEGHEETCTEDGNIEYWQCSKCHKYYSDVNGTTEISLDDTIIPAGHALTHHVATDTSCDHAGNTEYWSCSRCGKYYSDEACTMEIENGSWVIPAVPHTYEYTFNAETEKIIKGCTVCGTYEEITPTAYVPRLRLYATNQNAVQFYSGDLQSHIDNGSGRIQTGQILNLSNGYSSSIYPSGQTAIHYWGDSPEANKPIGFYHDGMFAGAQQGDTLEFKNLIFTYDGNYYVIGYAGAVYSQVVSKFININGEVKATQMNWAITADKTRSLVNMLADFTIESSYWNLTGTDVGFTWTKQGGTYFKFMQVKSGVESLFFEFTENKGANEIPELGEAALYFNPSNVSYQYLRFGMLHEGFNVGDKIILKGGATFTDTAYHGVLLREDLEFVFNGKTFSHLLGDVDLSDAEPTNWGSCYSFRSTNLEFDMTDRNGEGSYNPNDYSGGIANFSAITFELEDVNGNKYTEFNSAVQYFNMADLHGMQGRLSFTGHEFAVGDVVTIPTGSLITLPGYGTYVVGVGVSFRIVTVKSQTNLVWERV